MEWREQTSVSCEDAFAEAQRWMEEVTNKSFGSDNFRSALENGVLLCELINQLKPGVIKRMNRLSTPIAGLDNINVFLRACGELGLNEAQLFHPGDLQDLSTRATLRGSESSRRLKNVLITIYWLGRKAQGDCFYSGPQLNLKAFEGLLGIALSKALEEAPRAISVRDSGYSELWYPEREEGFPAQTQQKPQPPSYWREDSVESFDSAGSFDSLGSRTLSCISDSSCISNSTLRAGSDGCSSDVEAESCFMMAEGRDSGQGNGGLAPAGRCRRRQEEDRTKGCPPSHLTRLGPPSLSPPQISDTQAFLRWVHSYHSNCDSDTGRPQPDFVADDLASRRFRTLSPATPTNFAVPMRLLPEEPRPFSMDTPCRHTAGFSQSSVLLPTNPPRSTPPSLLSEAEHSLDELLMRALYGDDSEDLDEGREEADPVRDDLYARRVELTLHQTSSNPGQDRFLPRYWTPEEEVHVRNIRLGSRKRPWYRRMLALRNREVNPGWIWSKSMNDITPRMSAMHLVRQGSEGGAVLVPNPVGQDPLEKGQARVMDSEAKWHNDLTRWKLRRRMSNSDLRRKMQQRDNIGLMANAKVVTVGTFRSLQQDGDQESPGGRSSKVVTSTKTVSPSIKTVCSSTTTIAKEGSLELRPQTRALLARSYAVESHYSSEACGPSSSNSEALQDPGALPPSEPLVQGDKSPMTGPPSDGAGCVSTVPTSPFISLTQSHARSISSPSLMVSTGQNQNTKTLTNGSGSFPVGTIGTSHGSDTTCSFVKAAGGTQYSDTGSHRTSASMDSSVNQMSVLGPESGCFSAVQSQQQCPQPGAQQQEFPFYRYTSRAPGGRGPGGVSASLPRGYRRADSSSSCLSAGFTPRPFGAKPSRVSSLPGLCNSFLPEDSKLNRKTSPLEVSRPRKQVTISEEAVSAQPWVPANQSSVNQEVKKEGRSQSSILKTRGSDPATHPSPPASITQIQEGSSEMHRSDMRVSLSSKPNSRPDFGFTAHWDSTGARIKSVQPGSSAELCQLRAGDEIVSVAGHRVAEMSYDQWKGTMTSALQQGSLTMDVRCYGHHDWASSLHSQAFIARKTINLTGGLPTIVGQPDTDRDTGITTAKLVKLSRAGGQTVNGMAVQSLNGGFCDNPEAVRSKEHVLVILKNWERRAEFFKPKGSSGVSSMVYLCGGSVSAISDLQVPSLSTSSSWSWDPEEERRRQQSWQEEQERQLQEKYRRDQERLDAEWQQAQKEAGLVGYSQAEVGLSKGVMGNGVAEVSSVEINNDTACPVGHQPIQSQPSPPAQVVSNQKKEVDWERREGPGVEEVESPPKREDAGDFWSGDSYAFTELSAADRLKSKSTSSLVSFHDDKLKGGTSEVPRMKLGQSMSPAEVERQQILGEMRKRTALLTDSSWIRQRASSASREPVNRSSSMRRGESMDNLHNLGPSTSSSTTAIFNPLRPYTSLGFSASHRPPSSRHSMAGAYGGYSSGTQKHSPTWSRPSCTSPTWSNLGAEPLTAESQPSSQQRGSVPTTPCRILSSRQACSVCGCPLGRGAAMVIQALGLCFHLACFQCADCRCHLGGYELRTQIRIRNTKPYCDPCYIRRKSHFAPLL